MGEFAYGAKCQQEADWLKAKRKVMAAAKAYYAVYEKLEAYKSAGRLKPVEGQVFTLEGLHKRWQEACEEAEKAKDAYVAFILAGGLHVADEKASDGGEDGDSPLPSYKFPEKIEMAGHVPAGFTVVNEAPGGSTGAMIVEKDGLKYVLKQEGKVSGEHIANEAAADKLYRSAGIRVPDCRTYVVDGKTYKLAQFIDGGQSLSAFMAKATNDEKERVRKELLKGYPIDVLLGNWDVVGADMDNILVDKEGHAWRIDNGSTFNFRAQGAKKDAASWENRMFPDEWKTLRESANNKDVFGGYTTHDIWKAASNVDFDKLVASLPPEQKTPSIIKCAAEMKEMAGRCKDHDRSGYTADASSMMLDASYDFSKE